MVGLSIFGDKDGGLIGGNDKASGLAHFAFRLREQHIEKVLLTRLQEQARSSSPLGFSVWTKMCVVLKRLFASDEEKHTL
jgi:hypothetical protein